VKFGGGGWEGGVGKKVNYVLRIIIIWSMEA